MSQMIEQGKTVLEREAEALRALAASLDEHFEQAVELLLNCRGRAVIIGMGKSGHVGRKMAASLASLGTPAFFLHAAEAVHGDLGMIVPGDVLVLISHSGETGELVRLLPHLEQHGCASIAITGNSGSTLARYATVHLDTGVRAEADTRGLAPTTSATVTLALGDALAVATADQRGFTREAFGRFHPGGSLGQKVNPDREK